MVPHFRSMQTAVDSVNRILREQITGLRVVRAFVREDVERERFAVANRTYTGTALAVGKLMALAFPVVMIIFNASTVAVLWFGAHRIDNGQMEIGSLTAFMSYLIQILMSVMMATFMAMMIPRATVSAGRIQEVLDTDSLGARARRPGRHPARPGGGRAARRHLRLPGCRVAGAARGVAARRARHDDRDRRLDRCGQDDAASGWSRACTTSPTARCSSAASTCATPSPRTSGRTSAWCPSGRTCSPARWPPTCATATPTPPTTSSGPPCRSRRPTPSCAPCRTGLESPIAQGGTNVSGGQRQRLAIARALVSKAGIYLFDDAFSALDVATDARLRAAMRPVTRDAVVIVVAQRVSSIIHADRIVVLDDGLVVGNGTHAELLESCPTYVEIVESQQAMEEAA